MSSRALTRRVKEQRITAEDIRTGFSAVVTRATDNNAWVRSEWKDGGENEHGPCSVLLPTWQEFVDPQGGRNTPLSNVVEGATVLIQVDQEGTWWIVGVSASG